jgi:hypothetical protein
VLVRFTKASSAAQADTITCVRPDGSTTTLEMPRQGILPHDAFHFVVETTLSWHDGLFGQVGRGAALEDIVEKLHRQSGAWSKITQALQTEALVDCLQAEQWGGASDPATFAEKLVLACRRRAVVPPDITAEEVERLRAALREFGAAWRPLPPGGSLERTF